VPRTPSKPSKRESKALPAAQAPKLDVAVIRTIHGTAAPASIYGVALSSVFGDSRIDEMTAYARDVIARIAPQDPAEEMLAAQMLFAHARVTRLTELANRQTDVEGIRVVNEYADRASNTFRRLMLALAEYRRPPRSGDVFAVVKQANIAGQQVIQSHEKTTEKSTNEQGCDGAGGPARILPAATPGLPAVPEGARIAAFNGEAREAVGAVHRPKNR
jgi:hypothetical protein